MREELERLLNEKRDHKIFYLHSDICLSVGRDDTYGFQYECLLNLSEQKLDMLIAFVLSESGKKGFFFNLNRNIVFIN